MKHYFSTCEETQYVGTDMEKTHYTLFDFGSLSKRTRGHVSHIKHCITKPK